MTRLAEEVRAAAATLAASGIESPRADAELLAAHVLGVPRGRLLIIDEFTEATRRRFTDLVAGRARRVPLQHLTGVAPFFGLELAVGPGVFVPRPETELLAEWGIGAVATIEWPTVIDLCSGSGALALALATARPGARVYAVERSPEALKWLRRNVSGTGVEVVEGDVREVELPAPADLVLSNPPYVPAAVPVPPEVGFDPEDAVFAGDEGLDLIPTVIARAAHMLREGGRLGFEHDETHTVAVTDLLTPGFQQIETHLDLAGRPRFTTAVRRPAPGDRS